MHLIMLAMHNMHLHSAYIVRNMLPEQNKSDYIFGYKSGKNGKLNVMFLAKFFQCMINILQHGQLATYL